MRPLIIAAAFALGLGLGCSDEGSEADEVGVGAACGTSDDCPETDGETDGAELECLSQFAGGYCGLAGCQSNDDCPEASACVMHDDGMNYCFRQCVDKAECNANRPEDVWSNCSSNIEFVDPNTSGKACVPPSSGG